MKNKCVDFSINCSVFGYGWQLWFSGCLLPYEHICYHGRSSLPSLERTAYLIVLVLALKTGLDRQFHHPVCRGELQISSLYLLVNFLAKVTDLYLGQWRTTSHFFILCIPTHPPHMLISSVVSTQGHFPYAGECSSCPYIYRHTDWEAGGEWYSWAPLWLSCGWFGSTSILPLFFFFLVSKVLICKPPFSCQYGAFSRSPSVVPAPGTVVHQGSIVLTFCSLSLSHISISLYKTLGL